MPAYIDYRAIKDRVTLRDALAHYGLVDRMVEKANGQLVGNCPFHDSKSGTSFKISPSYRGFNCFGCDAKGNVLNFVARMESCSVHEAAVEIARWIGHHAPLPTEVSSLEFVSGDGHDGTAPPPRVVEAATGSEPSLPSMPSLGGALPPIRLITIAGKIPVEHLVGEEAGDSIACAILEAYEFGIEVGLERASDAIAHLHDEAVR